MGVVEGVHGRGASGGLGAEFGFVCWTRVVRGEG